MQEDELAALAAQMAEVMLRFEQRCQSIEQQQSAFAQQLPTLFRGKVDELLQTLSGQVGGAVREGLGPALDDHQRRLRDIAAETDKTAKALKAAQADIASQRRAMWWGMGVIGLLCIGSLVATYESLYGFYQGRYNELKAQVTYLDAINKSDVVPCGDGQLCARVNDKAPREGDKKQYRVVEPRQ
jgi:hypothetical protein